MHGNMYVIYTWELGEDIILALEYEFSPFHGSFGYLIVLRKILVCNPCQYTRIFVKTYPKYPKLPWKEENSYSKVRIISSPSSHV